MCINIYIYRLCNSTLEKNGLKPPTVSASYLQTQCFLVILQGQFTPLWPSSYVGATLRPFDQTQRWRHNGAFMSSGKSNFCTLPLWAINCVRSSCDPCDPWDWNGLAPNPWEIAKNPWENWKIPRSKEEPACPAFSTAFQSRRSFEKKNAAIFPRCFWQAQRFSVADPGNGTFDNNMRGWLSQNLVFSNDNPRENA